LTALPAAFRLTHARLALCSIIANGIARLQRAAGAQLGDAWDIGKRDVFCSTGHFFHDTLLSHVQSLEHDLIAKVGSTLAAHAPGSD
jgi:hypothetical protein